MVKRGGRVHPLDVLMEAMTSLFSYPLRLVLMLIGTAIGIGGIVATLNITLSASATVDDAFQGLEMVDLQVTASPEAVSAGDWTMAIQRMSERPEVASVGYALTSRSTMLLSTRRSGPGIDVPVSVVDEEVLSLAQPLMEEGRSALAIGDALGDEVLLPVHLARRLGVSAEAYPTIVYLNRRPFTLVGTFADVDYRNSLLLGPVVVGGPGDYHGFAAAATNVAVIASPGSVDWLAENIPLLVAPYGPQEVAVTTPPSADRLRQSVSTSLRNLLVSLASLLLVATGLGIANSGLMSVNERASELALRMAVGARRRDIGLQILSEGAFVGMAGTVLGLWLGLGGTAVAARLAGWTLRIAIWSLVVPTVVGVLLGCVAGLLPALRATRLDPADVLRR